MFSICDKPKQMFDTTSLFLGKSHVRKLKCATKTINLRSNLTWLEICCKHITVLISRLNKWSLQSCVIVKSKHAMKTCSSRRFQWYPTTYMCWAMTKPLLWIRLILSHSKGWAGLNTYRLWGIIGIVLMSTFLIHAYFLRSRDFAKPRLFSREISTVRPCKPPKLTTLT